MAAAASPSPTDKDLASIAEARALARRAKLAQATLGEFSQDQLDRIVEAMATAVAPHAEALARLAVEETTFGVVADKIQNEEDALTLFPIDVPWAVNSFLDAADPSMLVEKRNQTITPLQALAQLNNQLMVVMAKHFAARVDKAGADIPAKITQAVRLAVQRQPTPDELTTLTDYANRYGLTNTCRLIVNLNEFAFVD